MPRSPAALLALSFSFLAVEACSDTQVAGTGATAPSERSSALSTTGCDWTAVNRAAKGYFVSGKDPVYAYINAMQTAARIDLQSATNAVWPIMRTVASERLVSSKTRTAAAGAAFVKSVLVCTNLAGSTAVGADADAYNLLVANAALVLQQGIFSVRNAGETAPAAALVDTDGTSRTYAQPHWGVETPTTTSSTGIVTSNAWPAPTTGTAYLVFGYPINVAYTSFNAATAINTNVANVAGSNYNGFELGSLPGSQVKTDQYGHGLIVGVCKPAAISSSEANRLIHSGSMTEYASPSALCTLKSASASTYSSTVSGFGSYLATLFSATPLYAFADESFIGGHVSDWSPFSTANLLSADFTLTFVGPVQDVNTTTGTTYQDILVQTLYKSEKGSVVKGLRVGLGITGNFGTPGLIIDAPGHTAGTQPVDVDGIAHFHVAFTKAGGYTIGAYATLSTEGSATALQTSTTTSNFFHVYNK